MLETLKREGARMELAVGSADVATPDDLDPAFAEIARQQPDAVMALSDIALAALGDRIAQRALAAGIPAFGNITYEFVRGGALFNYAWDRDDSFRSVAFILKKILGGADPADIPVEQPIKFQLLVNLKTAKALGIELPPAFLARADEVIE
jgi:putative tryptophan/tyrosine transport system substrate-binding protein